MRSERRVDTRNNSTTRARTRKTSGRSKTKELSCEWTLPRTYTVNDDDIFESRQFFTEYHVRKRREARDREKFLKQAKINENNAPFYIDPDDPFDLKGLEAEEKRLQEEFLRDLENDDMPEDHSEARRRRRQRPRYGITVFSSDEDDEHWDLEFRISEAKRETKEVQQSLSKVEAELKEWQEKEARDSEQWRTWESIEAEAREAVHRYKADTLGMLQEMGADQEELEMNLLRLRFSIEEDDNLRECQELIKPYEDLVRQKEECLKGQNEQIRMLTERELSGPASLKGESKMLIRDEEKLKSKISEQDCIIAELLAILDEAECSEKAASMLP